MSRIIGAPPGYVGYDEGGQLTEKIKRKPYSVILLDEIEKAHPDVFNILLQVLEEGDLTDNFGSTISFRDTVIIMTSNVGNREFQRMAKMGFGTGQTDDAGEKERIHEEVKKLFSPEFLNRIDEVVYFHRLDKKHIRKIVDLMLEEIRENLSGREIELEFSPGVRSLLAEEGYDEKFGARFLRRTIQSRIEDPLATEMLRGKYRDCDKIHVGLKSDTIHFRAHRREKQPNQSSEKDEVPVSR